MKKFLAVLLCTAMLLTGCRLVRKLPQQTLPQTQEPTQPARPPKPALPAVTPEVKAQWDAMLEEHKFEGIVYLTYNGKAIYKFLSGTDDGGNPLTLDSPMYMNSVSKQFCAAAIMMLRDQGKLCLDDTLEKYFPEYTVGKDITLRNLLTMRSGIVRDFQLVLDHPDRFMNKRQEEVKYAMFRWLYERPLEFQPDTDFAYGNVNYMLLSEVVEQVSGERYEDFIRQNIFEPLGMKHSGFIGQVEDHPEWGLTYDKLLPGSWLGDLLQGCGDIVSTAGDMDIWMTALHSGKVVCGESYREMTTDYSDGAMINSIYGFGLSGGLRDGWGHSGNNEDYTSWIYFSEEYGYNYFLATGNTPRTMRDQHERVTREFLRILFAAEDAAALTAPDETPFECLQ